METKSSPFDLDATTQCPLPSSIGKFQIPAESPCDLLAEELAGELVTEELVGDKMADLTGNFVVGEFAEELKHELAGDLVGDKLHDLAGNFVVGELEAELAGGGDKLTDLAEELEHELASDLVGDKLADVANNLVVGELEAELADDFGGGNVGDLAGDEFADDNLPGDLVTEDNMANDLVAEVRLAVEFACDLMDEEKQSGDKVAFEFPGSKVTSFGSDVIDLAGDLGVHLTARSYAHDKLKSDPSSNLMTGVSFAPL
ncbi:hypothetical protein DAPPUDRAFT_258395 [Daphnia pulex]|uniref:Uncharacterized protein n=1 Tax=Daphnia pulex TaxID=6669 RepID=E9HFA8_DAPPU|nr:hypothetical protein DAPPUDRAFT_258395 [Daphnia pulex]|eukprot:EFX69591.1 hypothetical protein DAPPUDRAFT_258395 [Daphnia pulex]